MDADRRRRRPTSNFGARMSPAPSPTSCSPGNPGPPTGRWAHLTPKITRTY